MSALQTFEFLLPAIGVFYAFAGIVALRAACFGSFIDQALAQIEGRAEAAASRWRRRWLIAAALLVAAGGFALIPRWQGASVLFVISVIGQVVYFGLIAPRFLDPADPPSPEGRASSLRAFALYILSTALVITGQAQGALAPLPAVSGITAAISLVVFVITAGVVLRPALRRSQGAALSVTPALDAPAHLIVTPSWDGTGIIDASSGEPWQPWEMEGFISQALQDRLGVWTAYFADHADPDDPTGQGLRDPARQAEIAAMGAPLFEEVKRLLPGSRVEFEPRARPGLNRWPRATSLRLQARCLSWPLHRLDAEEEDGDGAIHPFQFGLSHALASALVEWNAAFEAYCGDLDEGAEPQWSLEQEAAFRAEGQILAQRLRRELDATGRAPVVLDAPLI